MSDKDSFVLLAKVSDYARFLAADGKLRTELFESNVRDYQGTTEVNGEIGRSLKEDKKIEFWWMNNGVTILSSRASLNGDVVTIENPQIVNGLQTSKKIFESQPFDEDDKRAVLVKIISSDDDEARDKIIKATNSQNPIQPATLRATDKVQRDIEEALRPYGYFYDRRKNYYKNIGKPAKSIISIPLMAQCSMSLILQQPDTARARPSSLIKDNEAYMKVFASDHPIDFYLNAARLISAIDGELRSRTDLSARDRNNIRFYALRWLGSELSYKLRPSATDIAQVKLGNNAQSLTKQAVDVALDLYNDNGGTDQLAKGPELLLALDAKIKDDLKSKLMG